MGSAEDHYIARGTRVRYDGALPEHPSEFGVVVHCWHDDELGGHDCYVAFFGSEFPSGKPDEKPYVLRYFSGSLNVIDE